VTGMSRKTSQSTAQRLQARPRTGSTSMCACALASRNEVRSTHAPAAKAASVLTARRSSGVTTCVTRASHLRRARSLVCARAGAARLRADGVGRLWARNTLPPHAPPDVLVLQKCVLATHAL